MGLKGYRLWVMGQLDSTCSAPPQLGVVQVAVAVEAAVGLRAAAEPNPPAV
jgi:hypothetical protein